MLCYALQQNQKQLSTTGLCDWGCLQRHCTEAEVTVIAKSDESEQIAYGHLHCDTSLWPSK